ncbi:peptidase A24A prepilin type IV [Trinickia dabaoshanensis]|uniref:Peptidase A24A prepilin type IV n=1 Tax=Trinickia dabaoshanensis TaxID=564714 RepID=A0A2N7VDY8_9BURK|nr:prepilin peptidase [Trinickia dabaoshanensis]PMS15344.1 peptidase A24A prepilin type IV [Trinickia dabaoshanensis]
MPNAICYIAGVLLLALSWTDLRDRRLPDPLVAAFGSLYLVHAWLIAMPWDVVAQHVLTACVCFAIGACLHVAGQLGGGDVKLASMLLLWVGARAACPTLALVSLCGLPLLLIGVAADRLVPASTFGHWCSAKRGLPYGVPLAIAGWFALLPHTLING